MRKKSIIIASIFVILIIIALLILIIYSKFYKKENTIPVDDISFEQNIIQNNIEDESQNTDDIPTVVEEKPDEITPSQVEEKEDTKVEEKKSSSQTVTPTKTSPNKTETKKETVKKENTSSSSSTPSTTTKPVEEKKESTPQVEQPKTEPKQEPKQETVPEVKVERCTNNHNHSMDVGNSGKWYNSKADAIADYTEKINYWGALWRNFEIEDDEYYKNCPYGYEVWSCMFCGKWTINYYYK